MSELRIYPEDSPENPQLFSDPASITMALQQMEIRFERWQAEIELSVQADQEEILQAYKQPIDKLMTDSGYVSIDVIKMSPEYPGRQALRQKFFREHTHGDDEVRFFVSGSGLFYIHLDSHVSSLHCVQGDLISIPANTPHWFDMGEAPKFTCIRLFNDPSGWVANYTDSNIAERFPSL